MMMKNKKQKKKKKYCIILQFDNKKTVYYNSYNSHTYNFTLTILYFIQKSIAIDVGYQHNETQPNKP